VIDVAKESVGEQFEELVAIIRQILSDKNGCLAAKTSTFEKQILQIREELEELGEAIKQGDEGEINEELGHVLFDVIYLAILGEKKKRVNLEKVFKELNWSMKFRHPHVFEGVKADTIEEAKRLKKERKDTYHKMKKDGTLKI